MDPTFDFAFWEFSISQFVQFDGPNKSNHSDNFENSSRSGPDFGYSGGSCKCNGSESWAATSCISQNGIINHLDIK